MDDLAFICAVATLGSFVGCGLRTIIGGRAGLFVSCGAVSLVSGIISKQIHAPVATAVIAALLAVAVIVAFSIHYRNSFGMAVVNAPARSVFALTHFERLDADGDGCITIIDLEDARSSPFFNAQDRQLLKHMMRQIDRIGHIVRTSHAVSPTGGIYTFHLYGINRTDLETYPNRLRVMFEEEFGEKLPA